MQDFQPAQFDQQRDFGQRKNKRKHQHDDGHEVAAVVEQINDSAHDALLALLTQSLDSQDRQQDSGPKENERRDGSGSGSAGGERRSLRAQQGRLAACADRTFILTQVG